MRDLDPNDNATAKPEKEPRRRGRLPGLGIHGRPNYNQAAKITARFGGAHKLAGLLGCPASTVYRWGYAAPYGCDGLIPAHMIEAVQRAARIEGVVLMPKDWTPERINYPSPAEPEMGGILS